MTAPRHGSAKPWYRRLTGKLCAWAVGLLGRTVRLEIENGKALEGHRLAGYWHGDSLGMFLVLRAVAGKGSGASALVTADARGDIIEAVMERYGGRAVRVPDGVAIRRSLGLLTREAEEGGILAAALDGPTGPLHKPKKLLFRLAQRSGREVLQLRFVYSWALRLRRWDHYAVPMPFSRVCVRVEPVGAVSLEDLTHFRRVERKLATVVPLPAPKRCGGIVEPMENVV